MELVMAIRLSAEAQQGISDQAYGLPWPCGSCPNTLRITGIRHEPVLGLVNLQDAWVTK